MKHLTLTLAAILLALAFPAFAFPVTVQSCDREITFDAPPRRGASNDVTLTEMMIALGLTDRMAGYTGVTAYSDIDEGMRAALAGLPEFSAGYPSREVLVGADLDFWFAGWNYGLKAGGEVTPDTLAPFGIAVYELTESCVHIMDRERASMEDLFTDIRNLGAIFGVPERADALISEWRAELAEIAAAIPAGEPARVFLYSSGEDTPKTTARYAIFTPMIEAAGGRNIMDDVESSWTAVSWESVVERNPEVVVILNFKGGVTAEEKIAFWRSNPALANVDAVVNNRFMVLDYVGVSPGPRNIEVIRALAAAFHGE